MIPSKPRPLVSPPNVVPREYGLLSVVQMRPQPVDSEGRSVSHWRNGVTWESVCGTGDTTFDDECTTASGISKSVNIERQPRGTNAVTVYVEIECSAPGYNPGEQSIVARAELERVEEMRLESAFWTGSVHGGSETYYPHLAANAEVYDSPGSLTAVLLQSAATQVTGAALDIAEGLGRLEHAAASGCVKGQLVIHMTAVVAELAASRGLLQARNGRLWTMAGNAVVVGAGYTGSSPSGTSTAGVHWMYATGQIFAYRSDLEELGAFREQFNREDNTVTTIVERTYVLGFDCCHVAIPISLGGNAGGAFNSAAAA